MKHRVVKAIGERAEGVWLSTFHKFCLEKILQATNPDSQPLDEIDHKILLRRHIGELDLKHFRRLQDPGEFISDFVTFFALPGRAGNAGRLRAIRRRAAQETRSQQETAGTRRAANRRG